MHELVVGSVKDGILFYLSHAGKFVYPIQYK